MQCRNLEKMPEAVFNTSVYFKNAYEDEWITDPVAREITCGDNCARWILKLSEKEDITINLRHLMDFGKDMFDIRILNTNQVVHSMKELVPIAGLYV